MCGASSVINGELSEYVADILDAMASTGSSEEVICSEDLLSHMDKLAEQMQDEEEPTGGMCVGSLDVKALYPSLDIPICAEIAKQRLIGGDLKFDGVCYKTATHYLALNMTQEEVTRNGLGEVVPMRRHKNGERPGISGYSYDSSANRWKLSRDPAQKRSA